MRYVASRGWQAEDDVDVHSWFQDLVLEIGVDAEALAPVDTGRLKASIGVDIHGDVGIIEATAPYALYVEEGHRIAYRGADGEVHFTGGFVPPQSFLRAALYRAR